MTNELPVGELKVYTPGMAIELIEKSEAAGHINRKISDAKVRQYTHEMLNDWDPAASTIVLDTNGVLIDGYHRMYACIEAGVPFTTFEIVSPDGARTVTKVDVGRHRSGADMLTMDGYKYANCLASAIRFKLRHAKRGYAWDTTVPITNTMILDFASEHQRKIERMIEDLPHSCSKIVAPTKVFFLHFLARSYAQSSEYVFQVVHGYRTNDEGLPKRDPAFVLRERLRAARVAKATNKHSDKLDARQETYIFCAMYPKWLKGEKVTRVSLPKLMVGGEVRAASEAFRLPKSL